MQSQSDLSHAYWWPHLPYPNHVLASLAHFSFSCLFGLLPKTFRLQNGSQNGSQNGARNWTPQKGAPVRTTKSRVPKKQNPNGTPKGGMLWEARLFYVALLFSSGFVDVRAYFGTNIVHISEAWAFIFYVFSGLHFSNT